MKARPRGAAGAATRWVLGFACLLAPIVGACVMVDKPPIAKPQPRVASGDGCGENEYRGIVYVVDCSGSMTDALEYVKYLLKRSVSELGEADDFHVICFSSGPPLEMRPRRLVAATERNQQAAFEFIDRLTPDGGTDPTDAIERAFEMQPDIIFFLSDGDYDVDALIALCWTLNAEHKPLQLRVIAFPDPVGGKELKRLADANGGSTCSSQRST
jgi:hypothetical protein